ncbi:hypothetical protein ACS0TY_003796 [Phlomoides rotata]
MNMILFFVVILNPRHKLKFIEFSFDALCDDVSKIDMMKSKVKNDMQELFDTYKKKWSSRKPSCRHVRFIVFRYFPFKDAVRKEHVKTELDKYLSGECARVVETQFSQIPNLLQDC